jgi:hypothetical protein
MVTLVASCGGYAAADERQQKAADKDPQTVAEQLRKDVEQLKSDVEKLKQESSITNDLRDIKKDIADLRDIKKDIATIKNTPQAPKEAWWAFGIVGGLFVGAWVFVSWRREQTRIEEARIHQAIAKRNALTKATEHEIAARLNAAIGLLVAARGAEKK